MSCRPVLVHTNAPAGVIPTIKVGIKKVDEVQHDWVLWWLPNSTKISACAKQVQSGNLLVDLPLSVMYDVCPRRVVPPGTREIRVKIAAGSSLTPTCYVLNYVNVETERAGALARPFCNITRSGSAHSAPRTTSTRSGAVVRVGHRSTFS